MLKVKSTRSVGLVAAALVGGLLGPVVTAAPAPAVSTVCSNLNGYTQTWSTGAGAGFNDVGSTFAAGEVLTITWSSGSGDVSLQIPSGTTVDDADADTAAAIAAGEVTLSYEFTSDDVARMPLPWRTESETTPATVTISCLPNDDVTFDANGGTGSMSTHDVTFDANGGTGSMSTQSSSVASDLMANTFTRSDYAFAGWNTAADGTGTAYADEEEFPFTADDTLYAQWSASCAYEDPALSNSTTEAVLSSSDAFIRNSFLEVGARSNGSFGSDVNAPSGWHPAGVRGEVGFVADRCKNGWSTGHQDGDFFLPGSPYESWALQVGSSAPKYNFRQAYYPSSGNDIAGGFAPVDDSSVASVTWNSSSAVNGVDVSQTYRLPSDGGQSLIMDVTLENTTGSDVTTYYMRSVDADLCADLGGRSDGLRGYECDSGYSEDWTYDDWYMNEHAILGQTQGGDDKSVVAATQADGSALYLWTDESDSLAVLSYATVGAGPGDGLVRRNGAGPYIDVWGGNCWKASYLDPGGYLADWYDAGPYVDAALALSGPRLGVQNYDCRNVTKKGESQFSDMYMWLIIKKTIPAGDSVSFSLAYSMTPDAYATTSLEPTSAPAPAPGSGSGSGSGSSSTPATSTPAATSAPSVSGPVQQGVALGVPFVDVTTGDPVELAPSDARYHYQDGSVLPTLVELDPESDSLLAGEPGDMTMRLAGGEPGATQVDPTLGRLLMKTGKLGEASGEGFEPGSEVEIWLFSEPRYLGSTTVGVDGTFVKSFPVPTDIELGDHTIQAEGVDRAGVPRAVSAGVAIDRELTTTSKKAKVLQKRVAVTFPRNSTTLSSKDRKKLQTYLRKNVTGVQVTGYVQPSGGSANDTSLALSRATKAAGYVTGTKKKVNTSITSGGRKTAKIAECVAVKNRCAVITVSYLK